MERNDGAAVPRRGTARISYIGENSFRLPMDIDANSLAPSARPYSPLAAPYPQLAAIYQLGNWGFANYQDLEGQISHRMANGFFLQASYDWVKDLTNANNDAPTAFGSEPGNGTGPLGLTGVNDRFDLRANRGNDPGVRRRRFLLTGIDQLPFGRGRKFLSNTNGAVDALLGGWELRAITLLQTGPCLTPYERSCALSQANLNECNRPAVVRPDRVANVNCDLSNPGPNAWFNLAAFAPTPAGAGRIGNCGVGVCEGPAPPRLRPVSPRISESTRGCACDSRRHLRMQSITRILRRPRSIPRLPAHSA